MENLGTILSKFVHYFCKLDVYWSLCCGLLISLQDFCPEKYKNLCKIMINKFIKSGDASSMLEPYLSVITKGSCSNGMDGSLAVKDFDPRMSYVASPISGLS